MDAVNAEPQLFSKQAGFCGNLSGKISHDFYLYLLLKWGRYHENEDHWTSGFLQLVLHKDDSLIELPVSGCLQFEVACSKIFNRSIRLFDCCSLWIGEGEEFIPEG